MSVLRRLALCCGALLPMVSAADDNATLAQCAAVEDASVRLACYDALARRPAAAPPQAPPRPAEFGKSRDPERLDARIVGAFISWERGTLVRLDNGQTWKVVDETGAYYPSLPENAEVTITRGLTGYRMTIKAISKKIGVRRVR